ncbi:hypothetical protein ENSA5_61850 [Enhygromyxa salina]|uniref:Uncharacterized protein n=1 Tax=Enhygromyxa salina TaxID=215803 RepID=A0A2S9XDJ2_9BACT|nr:hypothetical protein [Enhygromyxa salina]PRP90751.1 hypothetical protein ENSA5_61850 [Enhygromyxa salina]
MLCVDGHELGVGRGAQLLWNYIELELELGGDCGSRWTLDIDLGIAF